MLGSKLRDRYYIFDELGMGGFGQTFLAQDCDFPGQPWCVVKQFKPQLQQEDILETARRLFDEEASVLAEIGNHSQIPQLKAHFEENGQFYLVQDFIEGTLLSTEFETSPVWSQQDAITFLKDILSILQFIHQHHVIHRDLKPENLIRRQSDNKLVLIDFGSVKKITTLKNDNAEASKLTVAIGTPAYMPLEQQGGKPFYNSDIYALGKIVIQGLTGLEPQQLESDENSGELLWQHLVDIDNDLVEVINGMVKWHPRDRYQTIQEVMTDLSPYFSEMPSPPPSIVSQPQESPSYTIETVVHQLKEHPEIYRIKKMLFCACYGSWENDTNVLLKYRTKSLLKQLYQRENDLNSFANTLNQIVKTLNKQQEYQAVANFLIEQIKPLYESHHTSVPINKDNATSKLTAIPSKPEQEQPLSKKDTKIQSSDQDLSEESAKPINLFDLRYEATRYTTPLRIKILLFSTLYYRIGFHEQDWSLMMTHQLDSLLQQVIDMFPTLTELENRLYATANTFDEEKGLTQTVGAMVQALAPFYQNGKPQVIQQ